MSDTFLKQFQSDHPDFEAHYRESLISWLPFFNQFKKRVTHVLFVRGALGLVSLSVFTYLMHILLEKDDGFFFFVGTFVLVFLILFVIWAVSPAVDYRRALKAHYFPKILAYLGDFAVRMEPRFDRLTYKGWRVFPPSDAAAVDYVINGVHKGLSFKYFGMKLTRTTGSGDDRTTTTTFHGGMVEIPLSQTYDFRLLMESDNVPMLASVIGDFDLNKFDRKEGFYLSSDEPERAAAAVSVELLQKLNTLMTFFQAEGIKASIRRDRLIILIQTGNTLFDVPFREPDFYAFSESVAAHLDAHMLALASLAVPGLTEQQPVDTWVRPNPEKTPAEVAESLKTSDEGCFPLMLGWLVGTALFTLGLKGFMPSTAVFIAAAFGGALFFFGILQMVYRKEGDKKGGCADIGMILLSFLFLLPRVPDPVFGILPGSEMGYAWRIQSAADAYKNEESWVFRQLLFAGFGSDEPISEKHGEPLLHLIADDPELVEAMLKAGAIPDTRDTQGRTALMRTRNLDAAKVLVSYGADVRALDYGNRGVLHYAGAETHDWLLGKLGNRPD